MKRIKEVEEAFYNQRQNRNRKILYCFLIILVGTLVSGLFGLLHDHLTFSLSPEFYAVLRFPELGIQWSQNNFWNVSKVGIINSAETGFFLSISVALCSLIQLDYKTMFKVAMRCVAIIILTISVFAILACLSATFFPFKDRSYEMIPDNIVDPNSFLMVLRIHNFTYFGSIIGMLISAGYQFNYKYNFKELFKLIS